MISSPYWIEVYLQVWFVSGLNKFNDVRLIKKNSTMISQKQDRVLLWQRGYVCPIKTLYTQNTNMMNMLLWITHHSWVFVLYKNQTWWEFLSTPDMCKAKSTAFKRCGVRFLHIFIERTRHGVTLKSHRPLCRPHRRTRGLQAKNSVHMTPCIISSMHQLCIPIGPNILHVPPALYLFPFW